MQRTIELPHGYAVTFAWNNHAGITFRWRPQYPVIGNDAKERRFWRKYYAARNEFCQDVADAFDAVVMVAGTDSSQMFLPSEHETRARC